jgi:hypothetical protein
VSANRLESLLVNSFDAKHVRSMLKHYQAMVAEFQNSDWEHSIGKSGKLVEATLKALWLHVGNVLPPARQFKAGNIIRDLRQIPTGAYDDTVRLTIPRACEFIYDIASNRGARHDPGEVDSNELDANACATLCSWIVAELLRYSQKGKLTQPETKDLIAGLVQRRYPAIEEIDGRPYFHMPGLSARQIAILALWRQHPNRLSRSELTDILTRHHMSQANVTTALARIASVVDVDGQGKLRLLQPGIAEAEKLIAASGK